MDINKKIKLHQPFDIPYNVFKGWKISIHGIIRPYDGLILTPGAIDLLEWKSRFYDRGLRSLQQVYQDKNS